MLPTNPSILVSLLNTLLRDDDMTLEMIVESRAGNIELVQKIIDENDYYYDNQTNQIKKQ